MSYTLESNLNQIVITVSGYPKTLEPHVDNAAHAFIERVNRDARLYAADAEGTTRNSIKVKRLGVIDYESSPETNYAKFIETGTDKGGVPTFQSLMDWLTVRGILPTTEGWDRQDLAYAIQQKIKKEGTPAQPFMKPSLDKNRPLLDTLLRRHLVSV